MATPRSESLAPHEGSDSEVTDLVRGLRLFAILAGALGLVGFVVRLVGQLFVTHGGWTLPDYAQNGVEALVLAAVATLVWALVAREDTTDARRLALGGFAYVVLVLIVGAHDVVDLDPLRPALDASVVGLVALIYPLLVPARRRHHLQLILLAAAYLPVGAVIGHLAGVYADAPFGATVLGAVAGSLSTWAACGIAWFVVLQQERQRQRLDAAKDDLDQLGSYTLESKIGEGGMGEVWRARHAFLARPAALKLIRAKAIVGGNSPEDAQDRARVLMTRFEREAQATAKLTSPHTVQVYDYGRTGNDLFFYVMELLDGTDLWSLVYRLGPQPEELVHHVLLQACDSIGEAHRHGLIHRDLKPANLFLCRQGMAYDVTKVLDFGLVKSPAALRGERTETHMRLTQQGMVSGTPAYMSPEQASGNRDLDGRSDLYALACVAYFLLTGREIFEDKNPIHIMLGQIERAPMPIQQRNPQAQLSPDFEAVLMRLLEKKREDRFEDASALATALRACRLDQPWTHDRARELWHKLSGVRPAKSEARPEATEDAPLPSGEARQLRALRARRPRPARR